MRLSERDPHARSVWHVVLPRLLVLCACTLLVHRVACAQAPAADRSSLCETIGHYRICGDRNILTRHTARFGNLLDLREAENVAHEQIRRSLAREDPNVSMRRARSSEAVAVKWAKMTDDAIDSLSLDALAQEASKAPRNSSVAEDVIFHAIRRKQILMSVDLGKYPDFLTVDRRRVQILCAQSLRARSRHRSYSPRLLARAVANCYTEVTGNLEQAWTVGEPQAIRAVFLTMVSTWVGQLIAQHLRTYLASHPRQVYLLASARSPSPRVSSMGQLYLPEDALRAYSSRDLDLILMHEASHVRFFTFERVTKLLVSYLPVLAADLDDDERKKLTPAIRQFLQMQAQIMEFQVDASVLAQLDRQRSRRHRYARLVGNIETMFPERAEAIGLLNQLADSGVRGTMLMTVVQKAMAQAPDFDAHALSHAQRSVANRYLRVLTRYMSAILAGHAPGMMQAPGAGDSAFDPMQFEEQAARRFEELLRAYERLTRRPR